jgi:hypothetical protein
LIHPFFSLIHDPDKKYMNKPANSGRAFDTEPSSKMNGPMQAAPGSESAPTDFQAQTQVAERRSPHRIISTASYYHPERRGRMPGDGTDEFSEGPDPGDEMDGDSAEGSFR